jgi:hypothetical protein
LRNLSRKIATLAFSTIYDAGPAGSDPGGGAGGGGYCMLPEREFLNFYEAQESISPAYVAWRASTTNRVVVLARQAGNQFLGSFKGLQIWALFKIVFILKVVGNEN